jgi:trimeric autotransporter adhesin
MLPREQMFGTTTNTYTMPGITSDESKLRQSGRLELTTTDTFGHLASDGGAVFKGLARAQAGIAIALAIEAPSLTGSEIFGMRVGYGNFNGDANAMGFSAMGVLCRDCFGSKGDRIALDVAAGVGSSDFMQYGSGNVTSARAGMQWTWK